MLLPSLLILLIVISVASENDLKRPSIAVIGGGIGGTSCSYFLSELFGIESNIDIFEDKEIGGRLATVEIDGKQYEAGGSIIHPANLYMRNFTKILGLKEGESADGRLAIYNGKEFVFDGSKYEILMVLQLFYQYGWDIVRINRYVKSLLTNFERIYTHQEEGHAFTTVENLLRSMDPSFVDMMHVSTEKHMLDYGFNKEFIEQLVLGGLRTNYGQAVDIHAFVGGVSMAGIEPGLWSVHGGNKRVPEELITKSGTNLFRSKVKKITLIDPKYSDNQKIKYKLTVDDDGNSKELDYDFVVIAAPLYDNLTGIDFENFPKPILNSDNHFHRTVATFVHGIPNAPKFKIGNIHNFPEELFTCNTELFFNSIGKDSSVNWTKTESEQKPGKKQIQKSVYKVFSQLPLTKDQINELFHSHDEVKVVDWMAYPNYSSNENKVPPFEMYDQLYYINAIEMAASSMETIVIAAKNAALLAHHTWTGNFEYINDAKVMGAEFFDTKNEL